MLGSTERTYGSSQNANRAFGTALVEKLLSVALAAAAGFSIEVKPATKIMLFVVIVQGTLVSRFDPFVVPSVYTVYAAGPSSGMTVAVRYPLATDAFNRTLVVPAGSVAGVPLVSSKPSAPLGYLVLASLAM